MAKGVWMGPQVHPLHLRARLTAEEWHPRKPQHETAPQTGQRFAKLTCSKVGASEVPSGHGKDKQLAQNLNEDRMRMRVADLERF